MAAAVSSETLKLVMGQKTFNLIANFVINLSVVHILFNVFPFVPVHSLYFMGAGFTKYLIQPA